MKFSEFEKLPYEKMNWSIVENEFNPCPKCGGELEIKDDWVYDGHWGYGVEDPSKFFVDRRSDWDEEGSQYYACKKCGNMIETEKSKARALYTDKGADGFWNKHQKTCVEII